MPEYIRRFVPGATFFFTFVTAGRRPLFRDPPAVEMLREAIQETKGHRPFDVLAAVVLPDHAHTIWRLPRGDHAFDFRIGSMKQNFTKRWLAAGGDEAAITNAQRGDGRRGVWQPRYHEHMIRDEEDHRRHLSYLHFNPVRHGLVERPEDWAASSLHAYIRRGWLRAGWGSRPGDEPADANPTDFGD